MPVDFSGVCFGLLVWVGGTLYVVMAARRARAARPTEVHPQALFLAGCAAGIVLFFGFVAIVIGYELVSEVIRRSLD